MKVVKILLLITYCILILSLPKTVMAVVMEGCSALIMGSCSPGASPCSSNPTICCINQNNCPTTTLPPGSSCTAYSPIQGSCVAGDRCPSPNENLCCTSLAACGAATGTPITNIPDFDICQGVPGDECNNCKDSDGVWTGLGCIHFTPKAFVSDFIKIAIGIAGGIALLLMAYGSFLISTSAGDPKKSEEGKEIITGTIAGLIFIIFSAILLRLIGVDILLIPGL